MSSGLAVRRLALQEHALKAITARPSDTLKKRKPNRRLPTFIPFVSTLKTRDLTTARLFLSSVPGGKIPRVETNERECWEFLDWRLASENDSLVPGQPSFLKELLF